MSPNDIAGTEPDSVLTVEERHDTHSACRLIVAGELDLATVPTLRQAIRDAQQHSPTRLILDLQGLEFIDSSGLAVLIETASSFEHIEFVRPSPAVQRVIELTGLASVLPITS